MATVGWSFLQALETPSMGSKNLDQSIEVYIHPMTKRSSSALSNKSLEMCTESLGSETGSDISDSGDEFSVISIEERERLRAIHQSKYRNFDRKVRRKELPPPLTSISGSDGAVKVRHHREGGRLVIKAVSVSNCGTHFQAERTNGRLKLSLLRDCCVNSETGRVEMGQYEEVGGELGEEEEVVVAAAEEEEEEGGWRWDVAGNRWRMAGNMAGKVAGKGDLKMVTRCKEGGNGNKVFTNWPNSWVAIS